MHLLSRRDVIKAGVGLGAAAVLADDLFGQSPAPVITKTIPSSGESVPVIGIGTARRYEDPTPAERAEIKQVLAMLPRLGGKVIDMAPSYGDAESVVGDLVAEIGNRKALFLATKVGAEGKDAGLAQIEASFRRLKTDTIDLIAVHNLRDTATQLATLRDLKAKRRIRYVGVTSTFEGQYDELERVIRTEPLDFVQVDYALDVRRAAARILPAARDRGVAVMTALVFGRGRLFEAVQGKPLPDWAKEFDCATWAQFFLKYLVAHPAVTIAIPGTARVKYLEDNQAAGRGRLPDEAMRKRMEAFIDGVKAA